MRDQTDLLRILISVAERFPAVTKNVSSTMCGAPVRNESLKPLLIGVIGGAFALMIFILRLCSVLPEGGRLMGWDDYAICAAVALGVPPTVFSVLRTFEALLVLNKLTQFSKYPRMVWEKTCGPFRCRISRMFSS